MSGLEEFVSDEMEDEFEDWILRRCCGLQAALDSQPVRADYIQELCVQCTYSTAPFLCTILRETQSSLRRLSIVVPANMGGSDRFMSRCRNNLSTVLRSLTTLQPFLELRGLSLLLVDEEWDMFWLSISRLAPSLETLSVDFLDHFSDRIVETSHIPTLPSLVDLSVTVTPKTFTFFTELIQRAPTLERLRLRGRGLTASLLSEKEVDKLVTCKSFKRLKLDDDGEETNMGWHTMLDRQEAFSCVETLEVGFPALWVSVSLAVNRSSVKFT